ncbi:hypothetical protein HS7_15060 [Sulfolobales archaeon HS-7]|nr:hypothetical protein HS7_15060 [Sulfolobales archaeon HS-7]
MDRVQTIPLNYNREESLGKCDGTQMMNKYRSREIVIYNESENSRVECLKTLGEKLLGLSEDNGPEYAKNLGTMKSKKSPFADNNVAVTPDRLNPLINEIEYCRDVVTRQGHYTVCPYGDRIGEVTQYSRVITRRDNQKGVGSSGKLLSNYWGDSELLWRLHSPCYSGLMTLKSKVVREIHDISRKTTLSYTCYLGMKNRFQLLTHYNRVATTLSYPLLARIIEIFRGENEIDRLVDAQSFSGEPNCIISEGKQLSNLVTKAVDSLRRWIRHSQFKSLVFDLDKPIPFLH